MQRFWSEGRRIHTLCTEEGEPLRFFLDRQLHHVVKVAKWYALSNDWWVNTVSRSYYKVITDKNLLVLIFWDAEREHWYLQRIYD